MADSWLEVELLLGTFFFFSSRRRHTRLQGGWSSDVCSSDLRLTPGAAPVPVRLTDCGLPAALSVMVIAPVRVPVAVGVKVTLMAQLAPAATDVPQVLVCMKSPLATMLVTLSATVPVLVSVTDCATLVVFRFWLANVRLLGERLTPGAAPVAVRLTVSVLFAALSGVVVVWDLVALVAGGNVTVV